MESSVDNHICPDEEYLFRYTESELKEVESHMLRPLYRYLYICVPLLLSSLLSFLLSDNKPILWAVIIGVVFFADFLTVMLIIRGKRMYASSNPRVISSVYEYKFYKDHFVMIIHRDNEIIRQSRHAYNEWSKIINTDKYILFVLAGQLSIIKKDQLIENSILYSFLQGKDEKQNQEAVENTGERSKATGSLRTLSIVLFICTLAALYLAVFAVAATSGFDDMYMENMWIFFLFTPISIASIVVGFILKARGVSYKKNIIAGFIMTAVLCIFGCFVFIFGGMYSNSDALLLKTEQYVGIDIPEYERIRTQENVLTALQEHCVSTVYFTSQQASGLEKMIEEDSRWLDILSTDKKGIITSTNQMYHDYDYILLYNITSNEYNSLPDASGKYRFISITYWKDKDKMIIVEYDIDYVK